MKEGKARVLNEVEFKRLLIIAKASTFALRNTAIIFCSFGLGLRAKEIASLKISDVIDSQFKVLDEVNLTRNMTKGDKQRHVYVTHRKLRPLFKNTSIIFKNKMPSILKDIYSKPNVVVDFIPMCYKNGFESCMIKQAFMVPAHIQVDAHSSLVSLNKGRTSKPFRV